MADRRAARSSNRRMTPTLQTSSTSTTATRQRMGTRATRSRSREVEAIAVAHSTTRNTRRGARQASVESAGSEDSNVGRSTRATRRTARNATIGDLSTVKEDEAAQQPGILVQAEDIPSTPPRALADALQSHRSPGAISNISGTTAISSITTTDAQDLDPDLMLDSLEVLHRLSHKVMQLIAPDDARTKDLLNIIKDLRIPESRSSKRFRHAENLFATCLQEYLSGPHEYIRIQTVLRSLFGEKEDLDNLSVRPDPIICKANVALFTKEIITSERDQDKTWNAIRQLDSTFPLHFISSVSEVNQDFAKAKAETNLHLTEIFQLALEIRTQLAILVLSRAQDKPNFDPAHELEQVFFIANSVLGLQQLNQTVVRGWDVPGLGLDDSELPQPFKDDVIRRVTEIRHFISQDDESIQSSEYIDLENLGNKYSWDAFILQVLNWARQRNREIESYVEELGGIATLSGILKDEVQSLAASASRPVSGIRGNSPRSLVPSTAPPRERRQRRRNFDPKTSVPKPDAIRFLTSLQKRTSGQIDEANPAAESLRERNIEEPQDLEEDDWQPALNDGEELLEDEEHREPTPAQTLPSSAAQLLSRIRNQEKTEKENRPTFIDRQPGAEKVEWNDGFDATQSTQTTVRKGKSPQRAPKRKQAAETEEEEIEEDGYESDSRVPDVQERRKHAPTAKRARFAATFEAPPSHQPRSSRINQEWTPHSRNPPSEDDADAVERFPLASSHRDANTLARRHSQLAYSQARMQGRKPRRVRNVWSQAETHALMQYIADFGPQWSMIINVDRDRDNLFEHRTNMDLKDKARNMKRDFLIAGGGLPPNFDQVTFGPRMEKKLRDSGIEF